MPLAGMKGEEMKNLRTIVVALFVMLFLYGKADAQSHVAVLTEKNNSVTKVMKQAGCNLGWLSVVMADSNIKPEKLRRLPIGQKIVVNDNCKSEPPLQV